MREMLTSNSYQRTVHHLSYVARKLDFYSMFLLAYSLALAEPSWLSLGQYRVPTSSYKNLSRKRKNNGCILPYNLITIPVAQRVTTWFETDAMTLMSLFLDTYLADVGFVFFFARFLRFISQGSFC